MLPGSLRAQGVGFWATCWSRNCLGVLFTAEAKSESAIFVAQLAPGRVHGP